MLVHDCSHRTLHLTSAHSCNTQTIYTSSYINFFVTAVSEECWEDDNQPSFLAEPEKLVESKLEFMEREAELMVGDHGSSHYAQKAEDFLLADDPALFSDEFSDPEDWGVL